MTPTTTGIAPNVFLKDLLMFFCWETYGLSRPGLIASARKAQLSEAELEISVQILSDIKKRAEIGFQHYHANNATRILKELKTCKGL